MERILQDMRDLLYPQSPNSIKKVAKKNGDLDCKNGDHDSSKNRDRDSKNAREIIIPVFLAPKMKSENKKDEIWNKRQIIYGIALLGPLGLVLAVPAILPRWMIFLFTVVWGFGSVGFPMGLYGTSRCEMDYSRHFARFIFMGFSLFVVYTMYRSMMLLESSSPSCSPPSAADIASPPSPATQDAPHVRMLWTLAFGIVGGLVMAGHMFSWVRGCLTGSDRDLDESESSGEDWSTSDIEQR
ncbi:hypothetical protein EJB05_15114, partial [Eragrostis curvula]